MKKNYFLGTLMSLLMLVALPVKAQVSSMVDLFGKYKFTADMTVTEAGKAYTEHFAAESDVVITKDNLYDAQISGIAGAKGSVHQVNKFTAETNTFEIYNWNGSNSTVFTGNIYMSNAEGIYPYGWGDMPQLGNLVFTYNPDTKDITMPDFTLVTANHETSTAEVLATFKNVKLTFVEGETVDIIDLSGDWHFTAGEGTYDVMEGSELPTEYDMLITKTSDDNKNYTVDLTYHTYPTVQLKGTFDGVTLTVPLDSTLLDAEKGIYLCNNYGIAYSNLTFNVVSKSVLSSSYLGIAQYVAEPAEGGRHYAFLQYLIGTAKRPEADSDRFDWAGTYKIVAGSAMDADPNDALTPVTEFDMVVEYDEAYDAYYIVNFLGNDIRALNYGGIKLTPNEENSKEATIATGGYVATIDSDKLLFGKLFDGLGESGTISVSVGEDGTIKVGDFMVMLLDYGTNQTTPGVLYQEVTATKEGAEEPEKLAWDGTYEVTADVQMYGEGECPDTFDMVVEYNEPSDSYFIVEFLGNDVRSLNYGGILLTTEGNTATIKTGTYLKTVVAGEQYYKLYDMNVTESPISVTMSEDGSWSIKNFCVSNGAYGTKESDVLIAYYTNVKAVKKDVVDAIESVQQNTAKADGKTYDLSGRLVKKATKGIFIVNGKKVIIK